METNTGRLDTSVASGSREKYTKLLGDPLTVTEEDLVISDAPH